MKASLKSIGVISALLFLSVACHHTRSPIATQRYSSPNIFTNKRALDLNNPHPNLRSPDFTLTDASGKPFTLSDQKGKVIVLNHWATNCGPCVAEIPGFIKLQRQMANQGVRFVGISCDPDGWKAVIPFAEKHKINYTMLLDSANTFFNKYGPMPEPTTFIINRRGELAYIIEGRIFIKQLKPMLEELAGSKSAGTRHSASS